jgi:hypothetical protein
MTDGECQHENSAFQAGALHMNIATMILDHFPGHRQTQPRPIFLPVAGEWGKHSFNNGLGDPRPVVRDLDLDAIVGLADSNLNYSCL